MSEMHPETKKENDKEKRFILSEKQFATERMQGIKEVVRSLKRDFPEVLSFCMYGSMVRGRAQPESDIDGYLFVDTNLVESKKENTPITEDEIRPGGSTETFFVKDIEKQYRDEFKRRMQERLHLSDEQVGDLRIRPIDERIIDSHITELVNAIKGEEEYRERLNEWEGRNPEEEAVDPEDILRYYKEKPKRPPLPIVSTTLKGIFHLDVGGGIRKYRGILLDKLGRMGETGERVWGEIIGATEEMEQRLTRDTGIRYPRTLEEARRVYGGLAGKT